MKKEVFIVTLVAKRDDNTSATTKVVFDDKHNALAFAATMVSSFSRQNMTITPEIVQTVLLEDNEDIMKYFHDSIMNAVSELSKQTISEMLDVPVPSNN